MKQALKFQAYFWLQTMAIMAAVVLALLFFVTSPLINPSSQSEHIGGKIVGMMSSICLMLPFMTMMATHSSYLQLSLSFGCTRKNHFAASQIIKILTAAVTLGVLVLSMQFANRYSSLPFETSVNTLIMAFMLLLAVSSIGELLGAMTMRFGRIAFTIAIIIMSLTMAVLGGIIGITFASSDSSFLITGVRYLFASPLLLSGISFLISLVLTVVTWVMCSKSTYR